MTRDRRRPGTGWRIRSRTTHPGEMLLSEFLIPMGISQQKLALDLRVPARIIAQIIAGTGQVTPEIAARLARYFDNCPEFWLNLQQMFDLTKAGVRCKTTP